MSSHVINRAVLSYSGWRSGLCGFEFNMNWRILTVLAKLRCMELSVNTVSLKIILKNHSEDNVINIHVPTIFKYALWRNWTPDYTSQFSFTTIQENVCSYYRAAKQQLKSNWLKWIKGSVLQVIIEWIKFWWLNSLRALNNLLWIEIIPTDILVIKRESLHF